MFGQPHSMMTLAGDHLAGFLDALAASGVPVLITRRIDFLRALALADLPSREALYWVARVTLVSAAEQIETFDRVFAAWFGGDQWQEIAQSAAEPDEEESDTEHPSPGGEESAVSPELGEGTGREASRDELLNRRRLPPASAEAQALWARTVAAARTAIPRRRGRRLEPDRRGETLDVRRVLAGARRHGGEIVALRYRRHPRRRRPLLLLIDVSGSLKPHSPDFLRFAHALVQGGERVEVFTFGTRLTRITASLRQPAVDAALAGLAEVIFDFDGGTRIGAAFTSLLANSRFRAFARGAVIIVLSDGLERGDPALMASTTERLARLGHRLLWLTPLLADPGYRPLTRGMRAILGSLDRLGSSASGEDLLAELQGLPELERRPRRAAHMVWREERRSA